MGPDWWYATAHEKTLDYRFFEEGRRQFTRDESFEEHRETVAEALSEIERWANLEKIEELLFHPNRFDDYGWKQLVTDALSGRTDRSQAAFDLHDKYVADGVSEPFVSDWALFKEQLLQFRQAFPDGIR